MRRKARGVSVALPRPLASKAELRSSFLTEELGWQFGGTGRRPERWTEARTCRLLAAAEPLLLLILATAAVFFLALAPTASLRSDPGLTADPTVFGRCSRPPSERGGGEPPPPPCPCAYFRPNRYFSREDERSAVYGRAAPLDDLLATSGVNLRPWALQVNAFAASSSSTAAGPPLRGDLASRHGLASVSALTAPKAGSRTIEELFRRRLSEPREGGSTNALYAPLAAPAAAAGSRAKPRARGGAVGNASPAFWAEVERRQRAESTVAAAAAEGVTTVWSLSHQADVVFALVRDPVGRFLSSIAQVLSGPMRRRCERCREVLDPCLVQAGPEYRSLLRCAINVLKVPGGFFDRHVMPQAAFLYGGLAGHDVEVAVFDMDRGGLDRILVAFGVNGTGMRQNERGDKILEQELIQQFGREVLLNPRRAREALDKGMVRDICEIYKMDVEMRRYLGFPTESCNGAYDTFPANKGDVER